MKQNSQYNFKEFQLGPDFAQDKLAEFKRMIEAGQSFTAMSMPGVGASYFLKYLCGQDFAFFIHIDLYLLPTLTLHEFYRLLHREVGGKPSPKTDEQIFLETKNILQNYAQKYPKVVVIFSRFDQLKKELDGNFLSNLQSLTTISPGSPRACVDESREAAPMAGEAGKIVLIFTAIKPLYELAPEAVTGGNLTFYSKYLYFKPYSAQDLKKLLKLESEPLPAAVQLDQLIELSGGHYQLLKILLNSQKQQNLLLDQFVKLQMKGLLDYLDYQQKKQIQKIALGKKMTSAASHPERAKRVEGSIIDEYLLGVGMVTRSVILSERSESKDLSKYRLFTPLLADYIKANLPIKLPPKEAKLFRLLRNNMGRIVSKDEIFATIWENDPDKATDWALDALIYRLRKHSFIQSQGFIIESHKKVGYTLII